MTDARFHPMNPDAGHFPLASVPILPVDNAIPHQGTTEPTPPCTFDDGACKPVCSGRAAIAQILMSIGARPGDRVMLPSYHCASMVEPLLWLGIDPLYFGIDRNLHADIEQVREGIRERPVALLLSHYFVEPQPMRVIETLCRENDVMLIEDCAHLIYGRTDTGRPVGAVGDFALSSLPKFFPTATGGLVRANRGRSIRAWNRHSSFRPQLDAILQVCDGMARYRSASPVSRALAKARGIEPVTLPSDSASEKKGRIESRIDDSQSCQPEYQYFVPGDVGRRAPLFTQWQWRRTNRQALFTARRSNWRKLVTGLQDLTRGRLLDLPLSNEVAPYMLPLLIDYPVQDFAELKWRGVPIWRWEDLAISTCPVANDYRLRLLQIPCHQGLTSRELNWMLTNIRQVLAPSH